MIGKKFSTIFYLVIAIYFLVLFKSIEYIGKNFSNLGIIHYLLIFLLIASLLVILYFVFKKTSDNTTEEENQEIKEIQRKNLDTNSNMSINPFKDKSRVLTTLIAVISVSIYLRYYNQVDYFTIILMIILVLLAMPTILYLSKKTSKAQLNYEMKNQRKQKNSTSNSNGKSLILILILGPLIAIGLIFLVALIFYLIG